MSEQAVERVLLWMANGLSGEDLQAACVAKLELDPEEVQTVIAEARKRLTLAADYNRDEMLGTAITRLNTLWSRCISDRTLDLSKALAVQREINRLGGLYRTAKAEWDSPTGDTNGSEGVAEEVAAAAGYLFPLELAPAHVPLAEHARLAVLRIKELERRLERKKGVAR